jgi:curli biogenesis system outer membrane secretion channel CsgG
MKRSRRYYCVTSILVGVAGGSLLFIAGCMETMPWKSAESAAAPKGETVRVLAPYTGVKKRLAVISLQNRVKTPLPDPTWQLGEGLTEMLTNELFKTGRFTMVERAALADIVREQELGQTGLIQRETAAKVGEVLGAQLLVAGAVTEFEASSGGGGAGVNMAGFALALKGNFAHVAVDIRLVDSSTGQILSSFNATAKAQQTGITFAADVQGTRFGSDAFLKTPLGKATREAVAKAVEFISNEMEGVVWTGRVIQVKNQEVYINAGQNMNLKTGLALEAFNKGEELVDPSTGLRLGSRDTFAGVVTLTHVEDKFSIGTFDGKGLLKRGDILKLK